MSSGVCARGGLYEVNLETHAANPSAVEGFLEGLWAWETVEAEYALEELCRFGWAWDGKADVVDRC